MLLCTEQLKIKMWKWHTGYCVMFNVSVTWCEGSVSHTVSVSARRLQQRSRTLIFSSCLLAAVDCSVLYERENASDVDDPLRIHVMCPEQRHAGKERAVCGNLCVCSGCVCWYFHHQFCFQAVKVLLGYEVKINKCLFGLMCPRQDTSFRNVQSIF